ncbi:hypothetical protein P7K49_039301, partial [Saguinus oedipus]
MWVLVHSDHPDCPLGIGAGKSWWSAKCGQKPGASNTVPAAQRRTHLPAQGCSPKECGAQGLPGT